MTFSIEDALNDFFNNTGGGGASYVGTELTTGPITGGGDAFDGATADSTDGITNDDYPGFPDPFGDGYDGYDEENAHYWAGPSAAENWIGIDWAVYRDEWYELYHHDGTPDRTYFRTYGVYLRDQESVEDIPEAQSVERGTFVIGVGDTTGIVVQGSIGTSGNDAIAGNGWLLGRAGDDTIVGEGGADRLDGGAGNDSLTGGWGNDTLNGGAGDDTVFYNDTPYGSTVNLADNSLNTGVAAGDVLISIENVVGSSSADILIGNGAANKLEGGGGDDTLTGGWGDDTLDGGAGIDTVRYDDTPYGVTVNLANSALNTGAAAGDVLIGIENVIGSDATDILIGNGAANTLDGRSGNDTIDGGLGNDVLKGWYGQDTFVFSTALDAGANVDFLADFYAVDDTIQLSGSVFGAAGGPGYLGAAAFTIGASATNAQQKIIYNAATGEIFYDADGSGAGAQVKFASIQATTPLSAADFYLV